MGGKEGFAAQSLGRVADVLHHAQVMGHEYIGQVKLLLKLVQQV